MNIHNEPIYLWNSLGNAVESMDLRSFIRLGLINKGKYPYTLITTEGDFLNEMKGFFIVEGVEPRMVILSSANPSVTCPTTNAIQYSLYPDIHKIKADSSKSTKAIVFSLK